MLDRYSLDLVAMLHGAAELQGFSYLDLPSADDLSVFAVALGAEHPLVGKEAVIVTWKDGWHAQNYRDRSRRGSTGEVSLRFFDGYDTDDVYDWVPSDFERVRDLLDPARRIHLDGYRIADGEQLDNDYYRFWVS